MTVHDSKPKTDTSGLLAANKFPLLRRLATASLTVMLITATALVLLYWQDQLAEHKAIAEQDNERHLSHLTRSLDEQVNAPLVSSNAADSKAVRMAPGIGSLISSTLDRMYVSNLLKLKIYNLSGVTIYSTTGSDIGGGSTHPDWLGKALRGETVHQMESRDVFVGLHGEMHDVRVALTYMPLTHAGKRIGAIEIYTDTTAFYKHRQAKVVEIALIVFAAFILLYAALIFIVFRTDRAVAEWQRLVIESEGKFQKITESAQDAIVMMGPDQRITVWNGAAERVFGYSAAEAMGQELHSLIVPDEDQAVFEQGFQHFLQTGSGPLIGKVTEFISLRKGGEAFPVEVSIAGLQIKSRWHAIGIFRDITGRKATERKAETLLQAVENAGESMMITDRNAILEYVNPAFTKITGYSPEEIIGKTPAVLKSSAQDPVFYKELWDTITRGEVWHGTLIDRKKDGSFYPALMSIAPIHNGGGEITHYVAIQQDMTGYKKMEDQFLQAQKMEAIGTLVGGIAHDFNNMLGAIQGNVYLAKRRLENQPEVNDKLDNIEQLGIRSADMVKQLLTFARKDRMELHALSLNSFIKEGFKLARTAIPENIDLVYDPCQEELIIDGDATQLQQVLMNLLNNARDAVFYVSQPKISCSLKAFAATADFAKAHPDIKGEAFAVLSVRDNGDGIEKDHLQKVFEPFFTTKGVGEGTGLGLAMVYGAVQSHGGAIEVESGKGKGTALSIYLPLREGAENPAREEGRAAIKGRGETVLLVDDEESMRVITVEVLNSLGYKVLSAGDGEEALEIFRAHQGDISLLITDIVMPKMGGAELAKSIRLLDKKLPIIFSTGYDKDYAMSSDEKVDQSTIISKPFQIEKLSQLIRSLLQ